MGAALERLIRKELEAMVPLQRHKSLPFRVKAVDVKARTFEGWVSTYEEPENYDAYGDIVDPNFFVEDLATRGPASADPRIKVLFNHCWDRPIGLPIEMDPDYREDGTHGCWAKAYLQEGVPDADHALRLMDEVPGTSARIWDSMSFGYKVIEYSLIEEVRDDWGWPVCRLLRGKTYEISPVTFPANENARISKGVAKSLARKAIWMVEKGIEIPPFELVDKAGRVLSQKNLDKLEQIRGLVDEVRDLLDDVIASAEPEVDDEAEDETTDTESDEDDAKAARHLAEQLKGVLHVAQALNERN